jgi:hypothetical protein
MAMLSPMASSHLDLTIGVLGKQVPVESDTIMWKDGCTTVLPMVLSENKANVCDSVDIPIIKFMADFSTSTSKSNNVFHITNDILERDNILDIVSAALSAQKAIVVRGNGHGRMDLNLSAEYLDKQFAILLHQPVCIHGERHI